MSNGIDCPNLVEITSADVENLVFGVESDNIIKNSIWKLSSTVYGVLFFCFSLFFMMMYHVCIKRNEKDYQILE